MVTKTVYHKSFILNLISYLDKLYTIDLDYQNTYKKRPKSVDFFHTRTLDF